MPALALAHELSGQREQAITEYQRAYDLDHDLEQHSGRPADPMLLAAVYALKGEPAKELQQLEKGKVVAQRGELPAFFVALGYARLGDKNEAIEWLQRSYQNKEIVIADINVFPPLDPLRDDPRFQALAQKVIPRDAK
jgi:tetratricopeptide (TPR) repeat protein